MGFRQDSKSIYVGVGLLLLLVLAAALSICIGAYKLSLPSLGAALSGRAPELEVFLVWNVRLPRVMLAIIVGGGLAVTGAAIQGLFRNPLAEPSFIGITSGAMLFAVASLVFAIAVFPTLAGFGQQALVSASAFLGAILTTWMVYSIAHHRGKVHVPTMLLAGIAVTSLAAAFTGLIVIQSNEEQLRDITFWTLGSLSSANWIQISICAPIVLVGTYFLHRDSLALNAFLLGEGEALQLGFRVDRVKQRIILWSGLIVGVCISFTGLIGFVGLVIPHLIRISLGTDYRRLLVNSVLLGGSFLLIADSIARTVVAPAELPIGIITAMVGAPFFIWLLIRKQRSQSILL